MPRSKEAFSAMRENTKQRIETTALSLFARKGLSVTIGEIARAANLSQGLLYSHYPSKDALIAELVRQAVNISSQSMIELSQSDVPAVEKVRQTTAMMCQIFTDKHMGIDYFMFMIQVGMSGFQMPDTMNPQNPVESLSRIIAQGQAEGSAADGDPIQLATVYWAAIQGLCCYVIAGMPLSPDEKSLNRIILKENYL